MTDAEPVRKRPVQREHELQRGCLQFCRDAIDLPPKDFQLFAFDSAQKATDNQRARMMSRGVIPGTPDLCLFVKHKSPIWFELKWGNNKLSLDQDRLARKLSAMGHYAYCINSINGALIGLGLALIPMRPNAALIAADLDLKVQARVAKAEQRATSPASVKVRAEPRYRFGKTAYKRAHARGLV